MNHAEGYERMMYEQTPNAVRWWYYHAEDGFVFARGGTCRKARDARRLIREARSMAALEQGACVQALRPRYELMADGELRQYWPPTAQADDPGQHAA